MTKSIFAIGVDRSLTVTARKPSPSYATATAAAVTSLAPDSSRKE
jgi:hypothetical protein